MKYIPTGRPSGPKPRSQGTPMERGKALQVMVYIRPKTKDVIAKYANANGKRMSNLLATALLKEIAQEKKCSVEELIPKNELEELQRVRGRSVDGFTKMKQLSKATVDAIRILTKLNNLLGEMAGEQGAMGADWISPEVGR
jgi:hypothetical protein